MTDPNIAALAKRLEQAFGDLDGIFNDLMDLPGGEEEEPEPEAEWLWPVLIDHTTTPSTITVVDKKYRGPWGTDALNRAQKEARKRGVANYGAIHGDTYQEAVDNAQRYL